MKPSKSRVYFTLKEHFSSDIPHCKDEVAMCKASGYRVVSSRHSLRGSQTHPAPCTPAESDYLLGSSSGFSHVGRPIQPTRAPFSWVRSVPALSLDSYPAPAFCEYNSLDRDKGPRRPKLTFFLHFLVTVGLSGPKDLHLTDIVVSEYTVKCLKACVLRSQLEEWSREYFPHGSDTAIAWPGGLKHSVRPTMMARHRL